MGRQQEVKCTVQNIWEIFGEMTARPKANRKEWSVCDKEVVYVSACHRWFHHPAWLVTYLEMECGPEEAGTKL